MADNKEQFKNYRVGEIIGRGRFAIVYKAEKLDVRKIVALKVLKPEFAGRVDIRDQFREQAKQQAKLTHPRLVRVEDLREEHGQSFVAMEYMPLGSLRSWVTKNGIPAFRQTAVIIADIAEALDYLHGRSLVHGDITTGNILLVDDPNQKNIIRAKLSDLRIPLAAEVQQTVSESLIELTPEYISPEQAAGTPITPLSDQYVLGVVAYELLCGQPPFSGKDQVELYIEHLKNHPPSLQQINDQVTSELEQVVFRALEKSPENRYLSCGEFARALRTAAAATEQKRLTDLLVSAERLLEKQEFEQARMALKDALLIQPGNEKTTQLAARLEQQEGLSKNYQQAVDSLQKAETTAQAIRKASPNDADDAGLLKTFAPPSPLFWRQFTERWMSAVQLTGFLLLISAICLVSITAWIDIAADKTIQPTIVAKDRTSTPTFTPTFTPTPTSTPTPTPTPTSTPTPTPTPIGGGNGNIAFSSYRDGNFEIYVMNIDGRGLINLSNNIMDDVYPSWSPDGRKIAFYSNRDGNAEIYVMNTDGSGLINLSNNVNGDYDPSWSPDSRKIAFYSNRDGNAEIYVMNADGSGQINLSNSIKADYDPSWSPDGRKIVFHSYRDGNAEIYVMNADGSGQINLSNNINADYDPSWSPDGRKIVFSSNRDGNFEICVMNADGSGYINLSNNISADYDPSWSPDGRKIVFYSYRGVNTDIYVMNTDGSGQINLTTNSKGSLSPSWAP